VAKGRLESGELTSEATKDVAEKVRDWRYGKGALVAEETTRDAAFALQKALWEYDGSNQAYGRIRRARRVFRNAMRADLSLGQEMYQLIEDGHKSGNNSTQF
jgi:hypothetical protein